MGGTILIRIGIDLGGTFIKLGVVDDATWESLKAAAAPFEDTVP